MKIGWDVVCKSTLSNEFLLMHAVREAKGSQKCQTFESWFES